LIRASGRDTMLAFCEFRTLSAFIQPIRLPLPRRSASITWASAWLNRTTTNWLTSLRTRTSYQCDSGTV
jgi:hypothetical protein